MKNLSTNIAQKSLINNAKGDSTPNSSSLSFLNENLSSIHDENHYTILIMTDAGVETKTVQSDVNLESVSKLELLSYSGYEGDADDIINIMVSKNSETTALQHFTIQVITDNPEKCSFSFNVQSENDISTFLPAQLMSFVDETQVIGEIFHICCTKALH